MPVLSVSSRVTWLEDRALLDSYAVLIQITGEPSPVFGVRRSIMLFSLQIILTKPVLPRALSDAALGRLREALLSNSLHSGSIQNPGVNRGSVSVSNRIFDSWIQYTTHQPRNGIGPILSQDPCQVRGCLDYLPMMCIRNTVGSQDLKQWP